MKLIILFFLLLTGGVFIVIFVGIILACITLFIEFIYFKCNKNAKKTVNVQPANRNRPAYITDANRTKGDGVDPYGNDYGFYGTKNDVDISRHE